jgi:hypothetical protein
MKEKGRGGVYNTFVNEVEDIKIPIGSTKSSLISKQLKNYRRRNEDSVDRDFVLDGSIGSIRVA